MKNLKLGITLLYLLLSLISHHLFAATEVERFALVIGKNSGGDARKTLKYANRDASQYRDVLLELGGLAAQNAITLENPTRQQVIDSFERIDLLLQSSTNKNTRKEFFFYYSGHSDERGLLIDNEHLAYLDLKAKIDQLKAEVSVVVLDSCSSGNFTAMKGGKRIAPFMSQSSTSLKGKVFLASSSSNEFAQESEKLKGSFFTHNLVSAMRGAADHHPDGRITLNEAYQYAYNETLSQTESSLGGVQHPSYSIQLVGNGELVMTDLSQASGQLLFSRDLDGQIFVRDHADVLIAEVRKFANKDLAIAVTPGVYKVGLGSRNLYYVASAEVDKNQKLVVERSAFSQVLADKNLLKGDDREIDVVNTEFSLVPDLSTYQYEAERRTLHHFSLSLLYSRYEILEGAAVSVGANIVDEYAKGAQFSLVGNMSKGTMQGAQFAHGINYVQDVGQGAQFSAFGNYAGTANNLYQFSAIANHLKNGGKGAQFSAISNTSFNDFKGAQISAISNIVKADITGAQIAAVFNKAKKVRGTQIALVNMADEVDGAPIGLVNIIKKNGEMALGYRYEDLGLHSYYFRSGTKNFYTIFQAGHDSDLDLFAGGIGAKFQWGFSELGLEYTGHSIKQNYFHETSAVNYSKIGLSFNPYQTKYINLLLGANYNHIVGKDPSALEAFNRFRGSSDNGWFGYSLSLELRF